MLNPVVVYGVKLRKRRPAGEGIVMLFKPVYGSGVRIQRKGC